MHKVLWPILYIGGCLASALGLHGHLAKIPIRLTCTLIVALPSPSHYRQCIAADASSLLPNMAIVSAPYVHTASPAARLPQSPVVGRGKDEPDAETDSQIMDNVVVVIPYIPSPWSASGRGAGPASSPLVRAAASVRAWTATSPSPALPSAHEAGTPAVASGGWSPASSIGDDAADGSKETPAPTHIAGDTPAPTAAKCAEDAEDAGCVTPASSAAANAREYDDEADCAPEPSVRRWWCSVM